MNVRLVLILCGALLAVLLLAACGDEGEATRDTDEDDTDDVAANDQDAVSMQLAIATTNDIQHRLLDAYAEAVEETSGGRIEPEVFPGGQLGDNETLFQMQQDGTLAGHALPSGFIAPFAPVYGVLDLPFLFEDVDEQRAILESPAMEPFVEAAEESGLFVALHVPYSDSMRSLITSTPIESYEDIAGLSMRTFPTPEITGQFEAWGAHPVPLGFAEVYTALEQGTIDGLDNPIDIYEVASFYEVAPYYTKTNHAANSLTFVLSKPWFDALDAELQDAVLEAMEEVRPDTEEFALELAEASRSNLADNPDVTISELPEEDIEQMRQAVEDLWDEIRDDPEKGPALEGLEAEIEDYRAGN